MVKKKIEVNAEISEEQKIINRLKKQYNLKNVFVLKVPKNDEETEFAIAYLKAPDRQIISLVSTFKDDQIRASEALLENIFLEGDREILTDDELFFGAIPALDGLMKVRIGELKKN